MTKRAVLLIADEKQFPPAVFLANRLAALRGNRDVDVILATDWPRGITTAKEFGGPFELMDLTGIQQGLELPETEYFTRATYYSLFVPPLLRRRYERLLYLDADTYPEGDRVFALFGLDLGPNAIAAVRDLNVPFWGSPFNLNEVTGTLGVPPEKHLGAKYLNSGVLLIDTAAWARDRIDQKAERLIRSKQLKLRMPDQTVFNALLKTKWVELSPSFNMIVTAWASFIRRFSPPAILHFTGEKKPWHRAFVDPHPVKQELAAFLKDSPWSTFLADVNPPPQLLGGALPPPLSPQLPPWSGIYLDALVRHLRETRFAVEQGLTRLDYSALPVGTGRVKTAVVVIADDLQLPPAVFLASRLVSLKGARPIDIIVATDSAKGMADLKAFGGGIVPLDISQLHAGVPMFTVGYFTRAVYHCVFVPSLLMGAYDRVLYLDVDTYPENDRVFALLDLDMGRHALAAVRDLQVGFMSNDSNDAEVRDTIGADIRTTPGAKYLNSGVLLMQLRAWRREQVEKRALDIIRAGRPYLRYPDQTILNTIFQTRWLELSPGFNMITRAWASFVRRFTPPAIVHFTGAVKPWHRAFIDDHPVKQELAEFVADSPWPDFIARANPPPLPGAGLPRPAERQLPLWEGRYLAALIRYLRETPFADVEQGITRIDLAALPPGT